MNRQFIFALILLIVVAPLVASTALAQASYPAAVSDTVSAGPALSPDVSYPPPSPEQPGWPPTAPAANYPSGYSAYPSAAGTPMPPVPEQPGGIATAPARSSSGSATLSGSVFQQDLSGTPNGSSLSSLAGPCRPRWDMSFDALWLARSTDRGRHLGWTDHNPSSGLPPAVYTHNLWSDDALFPLAPGLRVQLAGQVTDWMSIEAIGWGLQEWSVGRTIYGDPDSYTVLAYSPWLQIPTVIGDGMDDYLGYTDKSAVASVEINQRYRVNPYDPFRSLSFLWGIRYFYMSDDFALSGSDLYNALQEELRYRTNNNLLGLQVGLAGGWTWDRFQLGVELKFGLYANMYSQHGTDFGVGQGLLAFDDSHSGTDLGTLVEVSLLARYRITDSMWIRAGYQFYGVSGLALGPRQLAGYDAEGSVGLDGLSVGIELTH